MHYVYIPYALSYTTIHYHIIILLYHFEAVCFKFAINVEDVSSQCQCQHDCVQVLCALVTCSMTVHMMLKATPDLMLKGTPNLMLKGTPDLMLKALSQRYAEFDAQRYAGLDEIKMA
jgi:hypothetical protein